jgi:hypothetical protein
LKNTRLGNGKIARVTSKSADNWKPSLVDCGASYGDESAIVRGEFKFVAGSKLVKGSFLSVEAACSFDEKEYSLVFRGSGRDANGKRTGKDEKIICKKRGILT